MEVHEIMNDKLVDDYIQKLLEMHNDIIERGNDGIKYYKLMSSLMFMDRASNKWCEVGIKDAVDASDYSRLKSIFLFDTKIALFPGHQSGCDHSSKMWHLLDLLGCDKYDSIYRILPHDLPLSDNGYSMHVNNANILLCLLYNTKEKQIYPQDKVIQKAEKFVSTKKPLWERAVVSCLLGIIEKDANRISESLQNVCDGFARTDVAKFRKIQCQNAYGLLAIAKNNLPEEIFNQIVFPENKNFSLGYAKWFLTGNYSNELYVNFEGPLSIWDKILKGPVAITRLHRPYLNVDNPYLSAKEKKSWYMDEDRMLEEFLQQFGL